MTKHANLEESQAQIDRFREIARELGCDEDEATFKEKLKVIARQKPKDDTNKKRHHGGGGGNKS